VVGQFVDVTGTTIARLRRADEALDFGGLRATQASGVASFARFDRRTPGSWQTFRTKRLEAYGPDRVTTQNLRLSSLDVTPVVLVEGRSGNAGGWMFVADV